MYNNNNNNNNNEQNEKKNKENKFFSVQPTRHLYCLK